MKTPKYSILIPIIKAKFLSIAVESVLKQSFSDWELILYNDCSPDNIEAVTEKFRDERIRYFKGEKNLGAEDPSKTWNAMLALAKGQFICLLGDDDFISKNYLEEIDKLTLKYPKVDLFRAGLKRVDENGEIILKGEVLPDFETWEQMMYQRNVKNRMQCTTEFVMKKGALLEIGGYLNFPRACGSDDATYLLLAKNNGVASTNEAFGYWRKSSLNISDNDSEEVNEYKKRFYLKWEGEFLDSMFSSEVPVHALYQSIDGQLTKIKINSLKSRLASTESHLASVESHLASVESHLASVESLLESKKTELAGIYSSHEWKLALVFQRIMKLFFPKKSLRRKIAVMFWKIMKKILRSMKKTKVKLSFYGSLLRRFLKPKKRREINLKSKKIAYVGHSFHDKTKSTEFLIDYLKQFFDVETILDESWQGKPFSNLSFIDGSYLGVIFFQVLPPKDIFGKIRNDNIIHFPMYDQSGLRDFDFWDGYQDLKIVNFSKSLHDKLKNWGFDSEYIQYFPDQKEFIPGNTDEVFFWQRLTKFSISTVTKLFGNEKVKIHIHKGVDPGQEFIQPSQEVERKYDITYTNWFDSRDEMMEKMKELIEKKGIYVAPREFEGIGMSFLEAMAMGKAVIAVNNPTMNEYIENGKTGYLFNLNKPKAIDLSNIKQVQKRAYGFMQSGRKKWEKDKRKIIDFIKKS